MSEVPRSPAAGWFNRLAEFLGPAYLKNAFAQGTTQEVDFLVDELGLRPGGHVLDVGCGPGRHALELGRRGYAVLGVDLSPVFVDLATEAARGEGLEAVQFAVGDVNAIEFDREFDALICLCQGGFGLLGGAEDSALLCRLARAILPGGRLALSASSSYFAVSALEADEHFDAATGVLRERSTLRDADGREEEFVLWTTCWTPRELALLGEAAGLVVDGVYAVTPGAYARRKPDLDHPEHLLVATRPATA